MMLVRFAWPAGFDVALLRDAARAHGTNLALFRAIEHDQGYAYGGVPDIGAPTFAAALRASQPDVSAVMLEPLQEIAGPSSSRNAPFHYVVETDVVPGCEEDFNAWYEREHLPGLAAVDGTARAMRYRVRGGGPHYYACYDLERPEILGSPAWLAVRATPWSSRVRPTFVNTRRTMFRRA